MPMFGDDEQNWPRGLRVILYGLGLMWLFVGVAILADAFMAAIEQVPPRPARRARRLSAAPVAPRSQITSATRIRVRKDGTRVLVRRSASRPPAHRCRRSPLSSLTASAAVARVEPDRGQPLAHGARLLRA